ncbi:uncharacterized protein LOC132743513 [Ruditapes philippinarum]|uniref:uncharacterized protein LOC132743513 n=1 Tax=Ruditapes philippinarum TaxID=129788 RepID=UPI00295BF830|nr:uncharacterized protein LOC132743513 [Ruditapes philippinarum]
MLIHIAYLLLIGGVTCLKRQNAGSTAAELNEFNKNLNKNFQELDYDNNGLVELVDFENRIQRQDYDKDGCVSFHEFLRIRQHESLKFAWSVFNHFDHDHDDCLEVRDEIEEFHEIDINPKDGEISIQELDSYYDKLFEKIMVYLHTP